MASVLISLDEYHELKDEIERLRKEMERIADLTEKWTDSLISQVNEIARTALQEKVYETS